MSTASDSAWKADDNPDRFGEELGDEAHIWRVYKDVADADDKNRVDGWNRGLDNLALFAGLLSAVTSAFLIEARTDLTPDPILETLRSIDARLYNRTYIPDAPGAPAGARATNLFWVASLILSLTAALIAIMGKDWIGMYVRMPPCNLRERADIRTFRLRCVEQWHMSGVISSAPVLLHMSLLLFGAGLAVFMALDRATLIFASVVSGLVFLCYVFIVANGICSRTSPFQSPATQALRQLVLRLAALISKHTLRSARDRLTSCIPRRTPRNARDEEDAPIATDASEHLRLHDLRPGGQQSSGTPVPQSQGASHIAPALPHWNDIPAANPDRMLQSLMWLRAASPHHWVERSIITALGDQTSVSGPGNKISVPLSDRSSLTVPRDHILGYQVARCLSDGYLRTPGFPRKEALLREAFRATLPKRIDWSRTDLLAVLRYIRLRKNWPNTGMAQPEDTQLDALFRDALLEDRISPEQYIYVVCLAANRPGLTVDLTKVKKHCEHIDLALTTAAFLMTLLDPSPSGTKSPFNELLVMTKSFGWHRRSADDSMLFTVLREHLQSPNPDTAGGASAGYSDFELLCHIILHYVQAASSEGLHVLLDLLERRKPEQISSLFDLFEDKTNPAASHALWTMCRESPAHARRLVQALPPEKPPVPGQYRTLTGITRSVVILALSWLVPSAQIFSSLQSHRTCVISEIQSASAPVARANEVTSSVLRYSAVTHPLKPATCYWELLTAIAAYLARCVQKLLPDGKDTEESSNAGPALQEVTNLLKQFNAVGPNGEPGDSTELCNLGRLLGNLAEDVAFSDEIARFLRTLDELRKVCEQSPLRDIGAAYLSNKDLIERWTTIKRHELVLDVSGNRYPASFYKAIFRDTIVAVKILSGTSLGFDRMVSEEVSQLRTLHHENIVLFLGFTMDIGINNYAMVFPWTANGYVGQYTAKFPDADRLKLISDVAHGLAYMHSRAPQILHMGLTPNTVLVTSTGRAIIENFGLSIALSEDSCTVQMWCDHLGIDVPLRELGYAAPELRDPEGICSPAMDIFAWSRTAVEILSDVRPFGDAHNFDTILDLERNNALPLQKDHTENLGSEAAELLRRCWPLLERGWAEDPSERPSMEQVVEELTTIKNERAQAAAPQVSVAVASTSGTQ